MAKVGPFEIGFALACLSIGCGGNGARDSASGSESGIPAESGTDTSGAESGSGQNSESGNSDTASGGSGNDSSASGGTKFDIPVPDASSGCGDGMGGGYDFSYIWIANSTQGTVSKVNTQTGVEEGRYYTHPTAGSGDPSRTSVNLVGDVAVSNRFPAGVTAIASQPSRCVDLNGNNTIDTSTGAADILPWGTDECVLWHLDFPDSPAQSSGARPTQWEGRRFADDPCGVDDNPRLWVGYRDGANTGKFLRIDGASGNVLDTVDVAGTFTQSWGPYGGVVNAAGDLWVNGWNNGPLIKIDAETLDVTNYGNPGAFFYGIGIDAEGNPWIATAGGEGAIRIYDDAMGQFVMIPTDNSTLRGVAVDREGRAWAAGNSPCGLVEMDVATRSQVGTTISLPTCGTPVGVSVDVDGYVWVVDQSGWAHKVDPETKQVVSTTSGLIGSYTYSDMTGSGLGLVVNPPG